VEVTTDELAAALSEGAFLLDVRTQDEWAEMRVPGATLIPLQELGEHIEELPDDQQIWVICAVGARSLRAAEALQRAGFDAVSVAGGTVKWAEEGRPVESGA
jgi:rhodanese-related sulfurtransferase